jgi:hypothetical protein
MTRKSLALATDDPSRSALSARIPEGCAGTVLGSATPAFPQPRSLKHGSSGGYERFGKQLLSTLLARVRSPRSSARLSFAGPKTIWCVTGLRAGGVDHQDTALFRDMHESPRSVARARHEAGNGNLGIVSLSCRFQWRICISIREQHRQPICG